LGTWTLDSVTPSNSNYDTAELYGTNVIVTYKLRYRQSIFSSFTETPRLDWHEKFIMKEHHNGTWWEFEANMYEHNPCSNTLKIWAGRYIHAYKAAMGLPDLATKGSSKLLKSNGGPITPKDLKPSLSLDSEKANAVRDYLKSNGGFLEITIHDIPSINRPKATDHKERLLQFKCGVVLGTTSWQGEQLLNLNGATHESTWTRDFSASHPAFNTTGLTQVAAPTMVSNPRKPCFMPGECW
jgi:hypothetical protein